MEHMDERTRERAGETANQAAGQTAAALHILQITDCHLFPTPESTLLGVCVFESLHAVLRAACAERRPDAVLATGDLAQRPSAATYRLFLAAVREHFRGPLLCVPGNHDHGATFADELPTEDLRVGPWHVHGIDTHVDDVVGGTVAERELGRLADALNGDGPALVVGHHCPVEIGCPWLDEHRIDNGEDLLAVLAGANGGRGASAYAFGHIHQPFQGRHESPQPGPLASERRPRGLPLALLGTPSTCFQFRGQSPTFAIDSAKPGYRWLTLAADGSVTTQVGRVQDYDLRIDRNDRDQP